MNNLCGYKSLEMQAIFDNLVCLTIEETLSKFHQLLYEFEIKKKVTMLFLCRYYV